MPTYLDTIKYYAKRITNTNIRIMLRGYYAGTPYGTDPENTEYRYGEIRLEVLRGNAVRATETELKLLYDPNADRASGIDYMENLVADRIDAKVAGVLPKGSSLIIVPPDEKEKPTPAATKELYDRVLNFPRRFGRGEKGFFRFMKVFLGDLAVAGDGGLSVQCVKKSNQWITKFLGYLYEEWDAQWVIGTDDPEFYRVEFRYVGDDGQEYFYRRDYYKDRVVTYHPKLVPGQIGSDFSPGVQLPAALSPFYGVMPVEMEIDSSGDIYSDTLLEALDDFVFIDISWQEWATNSPRGKPEMWLPEISSVDATNSLLNKLVEATEYGGNPPMATIDSEQPIDEKTGLPKTLSRSDYKAGAILDLKTANVDEGGNQAKMAFPENVPTTLLHGESMNETRAAALGGAPVFKRWDRDSGELSRLSGYAYQVLTTLFDAAVNDHRDLAVNRVMDFINRGVRLLEIKNALPEGIEKGTTIAIQYGKPKMTADEFGKYVIGLLGLNKMGVSLEWLSETIMSLSPLDISDPEAFKAALEKAASDREEEFKLEMSNAITGGGDDIDNQVQ